MAYYGDYNADKSPRRNFLFFIFPPKYRKPKTLENALLHKYFFMSHSVLSSRFLFYVNFLAHLNFNFNLWFLFPLVSLSPANSKTLASIFFLCSIVFTTHKIQPHRAQQTIIKINPGACSILLVFCGVAWYRRNFIMNFPLLSGLPVSTRLMNLKRL